ncbi:MAG: S1/P1 nuclease [Flavobacteriales bacterium]
MPSIRSFLLLLLCAPLTSLAWGPTGHRAIGEIADHHLSKKARKAITRILGTESLAIASTWMDEVRSDDAYDNTHDWHWVTIPDSLAYATSPKNAKGDVVEAIGRMTTLLRSDTVPVDRKRIYLRFLIHLVGDLHQPLHVGRGDDKGGNDFQVQWFKKGTNLHRVWDSEMIEQVGLSYTELALSLDHIGEAQRTDWQRGTPADWAQEAVAYRAQVYAVKSGDDIGYNYLYKNWPLVQQQLAKGGIRLATVLNEVFQ